MLIPSIDLQNGAVVQLVQGEHLAIKDDDVFKWVRRFAHFAKVQVIDLDAATGAGDNLALVRQIAGSLSCRVGGGIRTVARAMDVLAAGALQIIAGSALFTNGRPDVDFAERLADAAGAERVTAAGGITTREEIDALEAMGVDAVVGMAIYTGKLDA
jgi:phosphoribosylformimino-5-aminoimidazole carboxamide ribonucleotide (ProFAR) isomerase